MKINPIREVLIYTDVHCLTDKAFVRYNDEDHNYIITDCKIYGGWKNARGGIECVDNDEYLKFVIIAESTRRIYKYRYRRTYEGKDS